MYITFKKILEQFAVKNINIMIANSHYLQDSIQDIYKRGSKILYPVLDKQFLNHSIQNKNFTSNVIFSYGRWVE